MKETVVIGIAGGTGSGKTTLAKRLKSVFEDEVLFLCHDFYYKSLDHLSMEERHLNNFDHPNSFDTDLLIEHVRQLKKHNTIRRPVYSFIEHTRLPEAVTEYPKRVILIEGILIFENKELRDLMDIKVFVDTDADIRLSRRILRDIHERERNLDSVINQYLNTVKPMHEEFVEPSKKYADIIIPEGGMNHVAISMLLDKIRAILDN